MPSTREPGAHFVQVTAPCQCLLVAWHVRCSDHPSRWLFSTSSNHITCEEGTRKFCGLSAVVGPCGDELARAGSNTEELVVVDFPGFASYADDFARNPYFRDRRPELYASLVGGTRVESPAS